MTVQTGGAADLKAGQTRNLLLATWAFLITFWAWNLIAPLGVRYQQLFDLSSNQKSLLVAIPVLVGSLGRIVTGALTDRYGARVMLTALSLFSILPVLMVMVAGEGSSFTFLLLSAFLLGIAGTTFAVGIPFVNAWYEPSRRGFAVGLFGMGMGGTALSAFFTPRFVLWFGYTQTHLIIAAALAVTGLITWSLVRESPRWASNTTAVVPKVMGALKLGVTWEMAFLYAVTFGGFVAFSTYLPTYLNDVYSFDLKQAGTRAAGFALAAVVARPIGGKLSDRFGPKPIVMVSLAGVAALALLIALHPAPLFEWLPLKDTEFAAGAAFVPMAFFLGIGTGAVFAWVTLRAPANQVGAVAGVVGAAGGLGGFFPPLVMGATYDEVGHTYTTGLVLLFFTAVVALIFVATRRTAREPAAEPA